MIQYRNRPNGNGENVMRISQRLGREPTLDQPVQWTDPSLMGTFLQNMRPKLSRPGVMLMNKLVKASTEVRAAVDPKTVKWLKIREADWKTGGGWRIIPLDKQQRAIPPQQFADKRVQKVLDKLYPYLDEAQDAGQSVFRNAMVSASTEVRAVDQAMVTELKLYIENDSQLYRQRTRPVQENLEKNVVAALVKAGRRDLAKHVVKVMAGDKLKTLRTANLRFQPGEIWYERKGKWYFSPLQQMKNGNIQGLIVDLGDRNYKAKIGSIWPDFVPQYDVVEAPDYIVEIFQDNPRFKG